MNSFIKQLAFFSWLILTTLSCTDNYEKKVYFDLKVGGSISDAKRFSDKFRAENNPDGISKYSNYKHRLQRGLYDYYYYSSPLYFYDDTIVHTVAIYYFIDPKVVDYHIETTKEGILSMIVDDNYNNTTPQMVFNDILDEIQSKYGKADHSDTLDKNLVDVRINSLEDVYNLRKSQRYLKLTSKKIVLDDFDLSIDIFKLPLFSWMTYVSDRLRDKLLEEKVTDIKFVNTGIKSRLEGVQNPLLEIN